MRQLICGTTANASLSPSRQQQGEQAVKILWTLCRHLTDITEARPSIINETVIDECPAGEVADEAGSSAASPAGH